MSATEPDFECRRRAMVESQLQSRDIHDARVLDAMGEVPRERFVPADRRGQAYEDRPLPIGNGQTISQPYIVALMIQHLDVHAGHRVLDVGVGSGYQAAVLARLAEEIFAVERIADLAGAARAVLDELGCENVHLTVGDGTLGWPDKAPFDRIICGAAGPEVPPAWIDQLPDGGRIVMPTGDKEVQYLVAVEKRRGRTTTTRLCGVRFVPLIGEAGWPG